jgi:hypothetical protein
MICANVACTPHLGEVIDPAREAVARLLPKIAGVTDTVARREGMDRMGTADPDPGGSITVVSGLPRSGTSLMMQMLEAAGMPILRDDARKPDPSNPSGYYELAAVKSTARDPSWVARAPGHAVKVIHALLPLLPRDRSYRVILMLRNLREVIASQAQMLEARGQPPGDLPEARLAEIFAAQLEETRQTLDCDACFEWMEVQYADLITDARSVALEVSRFLGLSPSHAAPSAESAHAATSTAVEAMSAVVDASLYRVRKHP